jgi:hypothetical protein
VGGPRQEGVLRRKAVGKEGDGEPVWGLGGTSYQMQSQSYLNNSSCWHRWLWPQLYAAPCMHGAAAWSKAGFVVDSAACRFSYSKPHTVGCEPLKNKKPANCTGNTMHGRSQQAMLLTPTHLPVTLHSAAVAAPRQLCTPGCDWIQSLQLHEVLATCKRAKDVVWPLCCLLPTAS